MLPPSYPVIARYTIRHLHVAGLPRDSEIVLARSDSFTPNTIAILKVGRRKISTVGAINFALLLDQPPYMARRGHDCFLVFRTGSATTNCKEFVLIDAVHRKLKHVGAFQNGWAPRFRGSGIVYEYPRIESREEGRRIGKDIWLQKAWRWDSNRRAFSHSGTKVLSNLPPVPSWWFYH
jgi:hypothetical protein